MRAPHLTLAILLALAARAPTARASACTQAIRAGFDQAGRDATGALDAAALDALAAQLQTRPARCAPGDYALFIGRYAALLTAVGEGGLTDPERRLASVVRLLAPQQVAPSAYDGAARAFQAARAQLAAHLAPAARAPVLAFFDAVQPEVMAPPVPLGRARDQVIQGLRNLRWQLAQGHLADADAQAAQMIHALEAHAPGAGR